MLYSPPLHQLAAVVQKRVVAGKQRGRTSPVSPVSPPPPTRTAPWALRLARNRALPCLVWPCILMVPLTMTSSWPSGGGGGSGSSSGGALHERLFDVAWWRHGAVWDGFPSPLGLGLGLLTVAVGMAFTIGYHALHLSGAFGAPQPVEKGGAREYAFWAGVRSHLSQPEGFVMLGGYLVGTWMLGLMPSSYYAHDAGGINWWHVAAQLLLQDGIQAGMHLAEHKVSKAFYRSSHKPHHRFHNPTLFESFDGSPADTFCMILVPLFGTAWLVRANVWSYMAFGSLYANWLTLIHSEHHHRWDALFERLGLGTAADHHVHHRLFNYNYGHLFMFWDRLGGTYRDPRTVPLFSKAG